MVVMIEVQHLQKVVDQTTLIEIPEFVAAAGEITAVIGLTGQHKSTFLNLLTGQTTPTAGSVRLAGIDPAQERKAGTRAVGMLSLENGLYAKLSARQNLTFYCDLYGLPHRRADEVVTQVGLQDQAKTRAENLTASLARRLAFGRAILHQPAVLLLVDPLAECDRPSAELLSRLIHQAAEAGTTVLIITNDLTRIRPLCQVVVEMENGRVTQQYRVEERESQANLPFKIPARLEDKVVLVNPSDILYVAAEDGRTLLYTHNGHVPTHLTLQEVEQRLAHSGFFRAHRSYLVNVQHINEVITYTRNSYTLILNVNSDNERMEIPLSKNAARELREMLDY